MTGSNICVALETPKTLLGEGLFFSKVEMAIYWVDIKKPRLFKLDLTTKMVTAHSFDETISWVNMDTKQNLIVGCVSGIYRFDLALKSKTLIWKNDKQALGIRLNDAKCDREGKLFFGTMDEAEKAPKGELLTFDTNSKCISVDSNYIVSNGPAFDCSGNTIYSVSSTERTVFKLTKRNGSLKLNKSVFIKWSENQGFPDGLTVDSNGNIWIASWGGGAIYCYSPDGKMIEKIEVPAPYVTNITFAGEDYTDVYITTATAPMTDQQRLAFPDAGKLFHFRTAAKGIEEKPICNLPI